MLSIFLARYVFSFLIYLSEPGILQEKVARISSLMEFDKFIFPSMDYFQRLFPSIAKYSNSTKWWWSWPKQKKKKKMEKDPEKKTKANIIARIYITMKWLMKILKEICLPVLDRHAQARLFHQIQARHVHVYYENHQALMRVSSLLDPLLQRPAPVIKISCCSQISAFSSSFFYGSKSYRHQ